MESGTVLMENGKEIEGRLDFTKSMYLYERPFWNVDDFKML